MKSATIGQLAEALAKAQGQMKGAKKDAANPFFKSKYADLHSVWDACREALSKSGLSITQTGDIAESGHQLLVTTLMHTSGEWIDSVQKVLPKDDSPQALGSALTYARRYALAAMVGVYQEDDDAEAAQARSGAVPQSTHPSTGAIRPAAPAPTPQRAPAGSGPRPVPRPAPRDQGIF